ncbi:DUF881 domain-containing protein [Nocardioides pacificus]
MTPGSHADHPDAPDASGAKASRGGRIRRLGALAVSPLTGPRGSGRRTWRVATPLVFALSGALFVASAENSQGTDLRPGRYTDLASLVSAESKQVEEKRDRVAELTEDIEKLSQSVDDTTVRRYRHRMQRLEDPAGLVPREGPGVTVTLSDSPDTVPEDTPENLLVVHQQDIQAVVNAMWKGGASAITIAGQRIVSTTGIKCEGNSVRLQSVPYPQPFVISAVGDQGEILAALAADDDVSTYREQSQNPEILIGWDLDLDYDITAPAYDGLVDLQYAEAVPDTDA